MGAVRVLRGNPAYRPQSPVAPLGERGAVLADVLFAPEAAAPGAAAALAAAAAATAQAPAPLSTGIRPEAQAQAFASGAAGLSVGAARTGVRRARFLTCPRPGERRE